MKALLEKRNNLIDEMEKLVETAKSETRGFNVEEENKVEELKSEIRNIDALIDANNEVRTFDKKEIKVEGDKKVEVRNYNAEIRAAIESEKEIDVTNFEVEERKMGIGNQGVNIDKSVGNIKKTTFANAILKKASETSALYNYVRKENLGSALHQIPVQKDKITRFSNVAELAEYTEKNIDFTPIQLAPHKFGALSVISEEALADTGYDLMAELVEQYGEGAGETLDYLLVKGDVVGVQGLDSFLDAGGNAQSGAIKQTVQQGNLDQVGFEHMMDMYNGLPQKYRKNATWVIGTELASRLMKEVDGVGRPLLYTSYNETPFNGQGTPMMLGRPVVISDHVNAITGADPHKALAFFGDLNKALILGLRQNFTIKSSTEYAFIRDGVAIKGTLRVDAKRALGEALVVLAVTN